MIYVVYVVTERFGPLNDRTNDEMDASATENFNSIIITFVKMFTFASSRGAIKEF